ncbi:RNA recognition motif domain-containing protein [Pedobacter rhizosphaerae]|uniref:RNA recognition motif. (A.k.a. RRM, RBD, or RNP domain) n=1 Tax=Pedobacter rhizosphaerae TaxID=390241 RepID=A0A1H9KY25_9SPHI|nr:RNA-binding protein [Pedobacter rhizosphaerae]SER03815.1 RNA recognition motif. (a.k.a. RRM, RBD, or RNP domain) [Pedobacter rhizosphaerae]
MTKLFIGGLSENIQEMDLAIFVSLHGQIETIKVVRDRSTGKCKGYAFLEVNKLADANNIISNLNGETFKGNVVTVKICEEQPVAPKKFQPKGNPAIKSKRPRLQR